MQNSRYPGYPMADWSSEISQPAVPAMASTTTTTTSTTASSSAGGHANTTTSSTSTTGSTPAAGSPVPAPGSSAAPGMAPGPAAHAAPGSGGLALTPAAPRNEFTGSVGTLDLQTHQPIEVIEAPASMNEAFLGSLKSMLLKNRGNFVTATFLIGTQGTTAWEGILHDVGNDYVIIYQPGRERYIACDIYSLKYIEFYDTRHQQMCEDLMRQNGWRNQY